MNVLNWTLRLLICFGLFSVVACTKTVDTASNESVALETSDDLKFPTTNEFSACKLRRVYQNMEYGQSPFTGLFTYNKAGDPVSVVFKRVNGGWPPLNWYFSYNKQGRLIEFRFAHENPADGRQSFTHRYGYGSDGRIAVDTFIESWPSSDTVFSPDREDVYVSTFTYDAQNRIIKESIKHIRSTDGGLRPTRNPTFTYDRRGNLAVAGWKSSSYDNKVSIFRSHPVFQFIHRNYSVNNAAAQPSYNSKGLPLSVPVMNDIFFYAGAASDEGQGYSVGLTKAIYDCQ